MNIKKFILNKKMIIISISSLILFLVVFGIIYCNKNNSSKEATCIIQFESNGGTLIENKNITCGNNILEPNVPIKDGFIFKGWFVNDKPFNFNTIINEDIIITAKWEAKENVSINIVSFNSDGGSKIDDIEVKTGDIINKPIDPVKKGYKFVGWYLDNVLFDFNNSINEDINLIAKWEKLNTSSSNKDNNNDSSNKNYDDLVNKYSGIWYLDGYSDVYINIEKNTDKTAMKIKATNFSFPNSDTDNSNIDKGYVVYPCLKNNYSNDCIWNSDITITYSKWNNDIKKYNIKFDNSVININGNKFIKTKGNKDKYSNAFYKETLGIWYLYQNPNSTINITSNKDENLQTIQYCISSSNFNIKNLSTNSSSNYGCEDGLQTSLFNTLGIKFSDNALIISNGNETVKFYREKTTIKVDSISLNKSSLNMVIGETESLTANILPNNAYDKSIIWSSSNNDVATVDDSGKITAKGEGKAIITVKTKDGNHEANCEISVKKTDITDIQLNRYSWLLYKGQTYNIVATILPSESMDKKLLWKSDNPDIATVDSEGKVTARSKGRAKITVSTLDKSIQRIFFMSVNDPIVSIIPTINYKTIESNGLTKSGINVYVDVMVIYGKIDYTFDYIRVYKDKTLIAEKTNTTSKSLFIEGHKNGNYYVEVMLRDSDNFTVQRTSEEKTISLPN